jgi:2''-aminoglycoside nucleotidyltransferase
MDSIEEQINLIHQLMAASDALGLPLWLESGWAVDARLGRVTRSHSDVDLAIPSERMEDFTDLLRALGARTFETTEYGFLVHIGGVLLDCEPCHLTDGAYELTGVPVGSCPDEKQGRIHGMAVRCTSLEQRTGSSLDKQRTGSSLDN